MVIKPRKISLSLQIRRLLKPRMPFTERDLKKLANDEKGFEGECYFDHLIAKSPASTYLKLDDLLLEWRNNTFQIDSLLLSPHKIYLIDVKNIEGEFYIEGNRWFFFSGLEAKNLLIQLQRADSLLRPMLQSLGINLPIEAIVIFVNPEFTLFQANRHLPIILPSQINSFIKKLGSISKEENEYLMSAGKKLLSLHIEDNPFDLTRIPPYDCKTLKKGFSCYGCGSLSVQMDGRNLVCDLCGYKENLHTGVIRMVNERKLLFPEDLITVPAMIEWCGGDFKRKRMRGILQNNFEMVGGSTSTFYKYRSLDSNVKNDEN